MDTLDVLLDQELYTRDEAAALLLMCDISDMYKGRPLSQRRAERYISNGLLLLRRLMNSGWLRCYRRRADADRVIAILVDCEAVEEVERGRFAVNQRLLADPQVAGYMHDVDGERVPTARARAETQWRDYRRLRGQAAVNMELIAKAQRREAREALADRAGFPGE